MTIPSNTAYLKPYISGVKIENSGLKPVQKAFPKIKKEIKIPKNLFHITISPLDASAGNIKPVVQLPLNKCAEAHCKEMDMSDPAVNVDGFSTTQKTSIVFQKLQLYFSKYGSMWQGDCSGFQPENGVISWLKDPKQCYVFWNLEYGIYTFLLHEMSGQIILDHFTPHD